METEELHKQFPNIIKNLEILAEECAEVIQAKSKLIRFGLESKSWQTMETNVASLENEIGDVFAMVQILEANGLINIERVGEAVERKFTKLANFYTCDEEMFGSG